MAIRIVQIVNRPIIRGSTTINNLRDAIVRIGMMKTHDIVISLAISQLFKSELGLLKTQLMKLCAHSIEIAAISYAIAEQYSPLHAEKLLLAGLLHAIGSIPVIAYI